MEGSKVEIFSVNSTLHLFTLSFPQSKWALRVSVFSSDGTCSSYKKWAFQTNFFLCIVGKSCRLRWYNQLDPNINKKPFTTEEEQRLLAAHRIYGNKWAFIARYFKGRTDNTVKNQYHIMMARRKRQSFSVQGHRSHSKFQNLQKLVTSSMSSLHSLSFSQSTMATDSFSVDIFGRGRKKHLGPSISSCANETSHGLNN